jgi:cytochrome c oxidase subunit 4
MSSNPEETKKHIKLYWMIGGSLLVLTVVTVAVSYIDFAVPLAVTVALIIAITKGSLVASYFMHLIEERRSIHAALLLTAVFFLVLLSIPLLGHADKVGEYFTLPNANAPGAAAHDEGH